MSDVKGIITQQNIVADIVQQSVTVSGIPAYSSDSVVNITAGEDISKNKLVYLSNTDAKVYIADNTNSSIETLLLGITLTNVILGNVVQIKRFGLLTWNTALVAGKKYYLSTNGDIITPAPTTGFTLEIGRALTDSVFMLNLVNSPTTSGDVMLKAIYDTDNDGIVDKVDKVDGGTWT